MTDNLEAHEMLPLTLTQQDIYFDQLHRKSCALYNVGGYIKLKDISIEKVTEAHELLIKSYDIFGVRITSSHGDIGQYVSLLRTANLPLIDLCELDPIYWLDCLFEEPFEIENSELFKAFLLKVSANEYFYVGLAHHLIMDGWGFANWAEQLSLYYTSSTSEKMGLSWQKIVEEDSKYTQSKRFEADREYWSNLFKERPKKAISASHYQSYSHLDSVPSKRRTLIISREQHEGLNGKASDYGVSVSQIYLALVSIYFGQTHGVSDIVVGSPVHNRSNFAQKESLGAFVNVIPICLSLNLEESVAEFCHQIKSNMRQNLKHQRFPLGYMQRNLAKGDSEGGLFEIVFNYLMINTNLIIEGHQSDLVFLGNGSEQSPIKITIWEQGQGQPIKIHIDHNLAYFSSQDIDELATRFEWLISQMATSRHEKLKDFQIIPPDEYQKLMALGYGTSNSQWEYPANICIHELFEARVKKNPAAVAVTFEGHSLTYGEMNSKANQLARYLREQYHVKPDSLVGLYLERSLEMVIGLMGILKAGAGYVPLDPSYPSSRLEYMLVDANLDIVLTQKSLLTSIDLTGRHSIIVGESRFEHYETDNIQKEAIGLSASNLAYVMYTSGSTGQPKGVMIEHRQLSNFTINICEYHNITEKDNILQFSSISFDLFVKEFLAAFCYGATLVLRNDICLSGAENFYQFCKYHRISVMSLPAAFWHQIFAFSEDIYPELKLVSAGGEEINMNAVKKWLSSSNSPMLIHGYGPTEVTVNATSCRISDDLIHGDRIPIGKPNNNVSIYLFNSKKQLVPFLSVGEIYIGGAGLARGYFNRPELTAERFIDNPYYDPSQPNSSKLLYKTGDLARYLTSGQLEFVGRLDDQVKIRGFRIELGEIEYQISQSELVDSVVVLAKDQEAGGKSLAAYVKLFDYNSTKTSLFAIKTLLVQKLPSHMVPASIIPIAEWPLTPNGKIDKRSLPDPDVSKLQGDYVEPKSESEKLLAGIWAQILKLDEARIGVTTSFFELGGNSLLAVKLVTQINSSLNIDFALKSVFESQSIRELAIIVDIELKLESLYTQDDSIQISEGEVTEI